MAGHLGKLVWGRTPSSVQRPGFIGPQMLRNGASPFDNSHSSPEQPANHVAADAFVRQAVCGKKPALSAVEGWGLRLSPAYLCAPCGEDFKIHL